VDGKFKHEQPSSQEPKGWSPESISQSTISGQFLFATAAAVAKREESTGSATGTLHGGGPTHHLVRRTDRRQARIVTDVI